MRARICARARAPVAVLVAFAAAFVTPAAASVVLAAAPVAPAAAPVAVASAAGPVAPAAAPVAPVGAPVAPVAAAQELYRSPREHYSSSTGALQEIPRSSTGAPHARACYTGVLQEPTRALQEPLARACSHACMRAHMCTL